MTNKTSEGASYLLVSIGKVLIEKSLRLVDLQEEVLELLELFRI